jgi:hypothetical protein
MISKIQRLPLREVWQHEAYDFTTWLQENIEVLSDALGLSLVSAEREQAAGSLAVDLTAEDSSGGTVVIENQLERSDHDHLGKLVTYLASFDAKTAIWIVADPRPEHIQAVSWLNHLRRALELEPDAAQLRGDLDQALKRRGGIREAPAAP